MTNKTPFNGVTEQRGALSMGLRPPSPLSGAWRKTPDDIPGVLLRFTPGFIPSAPGGLAAFPKAEVLRGVPTTSFQLPTSDVRLLFSCHRDAVPVAEVRSRRASYFAARSLTLV